VSDIIEASQVSTQGSWLVWIPEKPHFSYSVNAPSALAYIITFCSSSSMFQQTPGPVPPVSVYLMDMTSSVRVGGALCR